jgi:hypothetical protein
MPEIPALGRQRQKYYRLEVNLNYIERLCLYINNYSF